MNPLHKLARKLTPVSTVIMMMMRPRLRPLSSTSRGNRGEVFVTTQGGLSKGAGDGSFRLACIGSIEMILSSPDMMVLMFEEAKGTMEQAVCLKLLSLFNL